MSKRQNARERNVAYWEEKSRQEGVEHIAPGTLLKLIEANPEGTTPTDSSVITCRYNGALITGKNFDGNLKDKCTTAFRPKELIPGFSAALLHMHKGEKARAFIRYDAAYGTKGDSLIPAYATLIFDIELVDIL